MKISKIFLYVSGSIFGLFFIALVYVSTVLFNSLDQGSVKMGDEARLSPIVLQMQEAIRQAKTVDEARKALKSVETLSGLSAGNELVDKIKKNYAPVINHFSEKNKDLDPKNILTKKRDFLDNTINFYRKEVPSGDIPLRSVLLNIVFDTNASFLNDSAEMEMAYVKRTREKVSSLKGITAQNKEPGVAYRVAMLDAAYTLFEKASNAQWTWMSEKNDLILQAEKNSDKIVSNLRKSADSSAEESRRDFLYALALSCMIVLLAAAILYFGYQYILNTFQKKSSIFIRSLRQFAQDKSDPALQRDLQWLAQDEEWDGILQTVYSAEDQFVKTSQTQLSISRNLSTPFLVFNKEGNLLLNNANMQSLLELTDNEVNKYTLDAFLSPKLFEKNENEDDSLEYIRSFCREASSGVIEARLKKGEEKILVELMISHITHGSLVGGKIILIREIRNEAERIDRELTKQIAFAQDLIHKISHGYELHDDQVNSSGFSRPVISMLENLRAMKMKVQERELLWQNEVRALLDQISRQKEIFSKLTDELKQNHNKQKNLQNIVESIYDAEECINDEVIQIEHNLELWMENRRRLHNDLVNQDSMLKRVRTYEESVRKSVDELKKMISDYSNDFSELQQFKEEARLRAINLAIGIEQSNPEEYAGKARAYAAELSKFCDRMRVIQEQLQTLVAKHPGGSLLPQLEAHNLDAELVNQVKDEHVKLSAYLQRWKISGEKMLGEGERAKELLLEMERKSDGLNQLNETCQLINTQAQENLERWN